MYRFLPSFGYLTSTVNQNIAGMTNNGFEMQVGYNESSGAFKWNRQFHYGYKHQ